MVMDNLTNPGHHHHHRHHEQHQRVDGSGDLGLAEDLTSVEDMSSIESSPPPIPPTSNGNGTAAGDGPNGNGPLPNIYMIGLEFVRQYYTVLHQGPLYLHRFYSEDSSFVHDDSKAVYGQAEIRERITQLNFCNCVAKILQVDSHETLGGGVVIQVRGELSNNGQPMKRFMQTFVLAPQTPKRFYVRNDIFHYQDDSASNNDFKSLANQSMDSTLDDADDEKSDDESAKLIDSPPSGVEASVNNDDIEDLGMGELHIASSPQEQQPLPSPGNIGASPQLAPEDEDKDFSTSTGGKDMTSANIVSGGAVEVATPTASAGPTAPKLYAQLFKNTDNQRSPVKAAGGVVAPAALSPPGENNFVRSPPTVSPQPPIDGQVPTSASVVKNLPPSRGGYGSGFGRDRGFRERRETRERLVSRSSAAGNDDTSSLDGDGRRSNINYPDSHQLFVGNLPHTVTQAEIKDIFGPYGRVAEVKILKPNQKNAGSKVPYFCFVVFEEAIAAQAAINEKTKITMKMSDGSNRRLNVEEKRPREMGEGRGFLGGNSGPTNFPRDTRENVPNPLGGSGGITNANVIGSSNQPFRRGDGGNSNRPSNLGGGPGEPHRNQPPIRSRTFRGTNRGGGGGASGAR